MPTAWADVVGEAGWRRHVGHVDQVGGTRLVELADGAARGTRVVELRSATGLDLDVLVDRACDLGALRFRGVPLSWQSPVGVRSPWLRDDGWLGWQRDFGGGLMTTAGLDHTMFPETDATPHYAYPAKAETAFGLHGRISSEPARLLGHGLDLDASGGPVLHVDAEVTQAAVFGEVLTLRRRVEVGLREPVVRVRDAVRNDAHVPTPFMLLYHVNLGWPLLDAGARLLTDAVSARPRGDHPVDGFDVMAGPTPGFVEQVTQLGFDGPTARAALVNDRLGLAVVEEFDTAALPHLFVWRQLADGTYVLGVEPSTNGPEGRAAARASGALRTLEPGEEVSLGFSLAVDPDPSTLVERYPGLRGPGADPPPWATSSTTPTSAGGPR